MKSLFFALIILMSIGCSKEKEDDLCCTIISLGANISLKNSVGEDLLDPENPNAYKKGDIKIYHLINGVQKRAGRDDILYEDEDGIYRYVVMVNYEGDDEYPITYIDWNETDRDTIKSEIYQTSNQIRVIKIWYNDALMWDAEDLGPEQFTIIK